MPQGSRAERVAEEIRQELSVVLVREVHDPGIGFVTLTRVTLSPDLQVARVYYTIIGDEKARRETKRALERATPFLRRHIAASIRLRRVPELHFHFDESVEKQDRIERILLDLQKEREEREAAAGAPSQGLEEDTRRERAAASEPPERSGPAKRPASDGAGGPGAKPPDEK
jgi:ribosome-binding factor A